MLAYGNTISLCWWGFMRLRGKITHRRVVSLVLASPGHTFMTSTRSLVWSRVEVPDLAWILFCGSWVLIYCLAPCPVALLLGSVPLVPVLAFLHNLGWHPALELVLPLVIKDNEPLQSIQPQLSRKGTRHVSRSSQRHYCNRKHLALTL